MVRKRVFKIYGNTKQTSLGKFDKKYTQNWQAYAEANNREYTQFCEILSHILEFIPQNKEKKNGRPKANLRDIIFCLVIRSYFIRSSHRIMSILNDLEESGIIQKVPKRTTFMKYLKDEALTQILEELIHISSKALKEHEKIFALDASGLCVGISRESWQRVRLMKDYHAVKGYCKLHICVGVNSGIITSAKVTAGNVHESRLFAPLLNKTAEGFEVLEVLADKGYLSRKNYKLISNLGATGYIPFRNVDSKLSRGSPHYAEQFKKYHKFREVFDRHYHLRSNVEAVFSTTKRKFGSYLLAKTPDAQNNEGLCKLICHNICVLIHELAKGNAKMKFIDKISFN